ncbi:MAG: hypothetical protein V4507_08900 [Verrucomicrobiota bacterium]
MNEGSDCDSFSLRLYLVYSLQVLTKVFMYSFKNKPPFFLFVVVIAFFALYANSETTPFADRKVVAVSMSVARTPWISGSWRTWQNGGHSPGTKNAEGRRDICSMYYPSIGLYDCSDPDYMEYACQLMSMCGFNAISFFYPNTTDAWHENTQRQWHAVMKRYGLRGFPRTQENCTLDDLDFLLDLYQPIQLHVGTRPLISSFFSGINPEALNDWKNSFSSQDRPLLLHWIHHTMPWPYDGAFDWVGDSMSENYSKNRTPYVRYYDAAQARGGYEACVSRAQKLIDEGTIGYYAEGISPGFNDLPVNGWGDDGPHYIERANGETYRYRWMRAVSNGYPMIFVPTWDDWAEGSGIEPTVEFGNTYLEITRQYVAQYKGITSPTGNFDVPQWIYKIRKVTSDEEILADMEEACELIRNKQYLQAENLVKPYVTPLGIMEKKYFEVPPVVNVSGAPSNRLTNKTFTLFLDVNRDTGFWRTNSVSAFNSFTSRGVSIPISKTTTVQYYASGNGISSPTNSVTYVIDTQAPELKITPGTSVRSTSPLLVKMGVDSGKGSWSTNNWATSFSFEGTQNELLLSETCRFWARAKDAAGNVTPTYRATYTIQPQEFTSRPFIESNGKVVIEAEHFLTNRPGSMTASGSRFEVSNNFTGASNGQAVQSTPNNGVNTGQETCGPRLDFPIYFQNTGTYHVWVRFTGPNKGADSIHIGLDSTALTNRNGLDGMEAPRIGNIFGWEDQSHGSRVTIIVGTPGEHLLNLWMREDGVVVDKMILTRDDFYIPGGILAESPRGFLPFLEKDGVVTMEAEHFSTMKPGMEIAKNNEFALDMGMAEASGKGVMRAVPDLGVNTGMSTQGPRLDYPIHFTNKGTYYIWVRMAAPRTDGDTIHVGWDDALLTNQNAAYGLTSPWMNHTLGWQEYYNGTRFKVTIGTVGIHTLHLWMREDGVAVDKVVMTRDVNYKATGGGPAESPRGEP